MIRRLPRALLGLARDVVDIVCAEPVVAAILAVAVALVLASGMRVVL